MRKEIAVGLLAIGGALLTYYLNFDKGLGFSEDKGDWGVFGDFIGGFSNPIITFMTMCMLIKSIDLQREANNALIEQNTNIKKTEDIRSFESTFFNLAEVMKQEFSRIERRSQNGTHYASNAINHLEKSLTALRQYDSKLNEKDIRKAFEKIDERSGMSIYSAVRSFSVLIRFITENSPTEHHDKYLRIAVSITPVKMLHLICIAKALSTWSSLDDLREDNFFSKFELSNYLDYWRKILKNSFDEDGSQNVQPPDNF
ncbi:hypothetical protein [Pseudomonas soli]|uniref:hypothetical protein n=1 Tax=Pseudomonas soli TaxID=1306993 RepID=UPI0028AD2387|nr:hypothetical protein [Pseudomonas soli]